LHPPAFRLNHRLSDWPDCSLELRCPCSPRVTVPAVKLLAMQHGNRTFRAVLAALRCSECRGRPAPVYLVAGQTRTFMHGPPPSWSLELVPAPR